MIFSYNDAKGKPVFTNYGPTRAMSAPGAEREAIVLGTDTEGKPYAVLDGSHAHDLPTEGVCCLEDALRWVGGESFTATRKVAIEGAGRPFSLRLTPASTHDE